MPRDLRALKRAARALAKTDDLKEIKKIRDEAENFRKYARSAALGIQIQNRAAELKLRAERRAGGLLLKLKLHGGDRKSRSHDEGLRLADFGIDHNQSARWQQEAAVPDKAFEAYVTEANASGEEITAKGLLRLVRKTPGENSERGRRNPDAANGDNGLGVSMSRSRRSVNASVADHEFCRDSGSGDETAMGLINDLRDHYGLLANLLKHSPEGHRKRLQAAERRMVSRLLADSERLLASLQTLLLNSADG